MSHVFSLFYATNDNVKPMKRFSKGSKIAHFIVKNQNIMRKITLTIEMKHLEM